MESILEIETDLLPPEKIPTAPFEFPKAWSKSTISDSDYFFRGEKCTGDFYAASRVLPLVHTSSTRACISSERHTVTKDPQSLVNKQDRQNWC